MPLAVVIVLLDYVLIELLPEILGGRAAQQARRNVARRIDPEKTYRALADQLAATDTITNRAALAAECCEIGRYDEAIQHYECILALPLGHEARYVFAKAKAQFGAGRPLDAITALDELQTQWPAFETADAHLLYARALADAGRNDDALAEYQALLSYAPGAEASVRYGQLLQALGRTSEAKVVFAEFVVQMKRAPKFARKAQAEWLSIAEKSLAAS
ncbi:MAG: tetratricopeptide repeat protein [Hyphomicrobiales bacterium]|nr:tetratricopeptide repeat protein [Hyphomicrobiales bacterium]